MVFLLTSLSSLLQKMLPDVPLFYLIIFSPFPPIYLHTTLGTNFKLWAPRFLAFKLFSCFLSWAPFYTSFIHFSSFFATPWVTLKMLNLRKKYVYLSFISRLFDFFMIFIAFMKCFIPFSRLLVEREPLFLYSFCQKKRSKLNYILYFF